jgi:hypothetical protein
MFFYKFNERVGKYYKYDMDEYDIMAPMFDESLHVMTDAGTKLPEGKICPYCNTEFPNRRQNSYHLGYHGFPVEPPSEPKGVQDPKKGDEGMGVRKVRRRKLVSRSAMELLAEDLRLIDIKKN